MLIILLQYQKDTARRDRVKGLPMAPQAAVIRPMPDHGFIRSRLCDHDSFDSIIHSIRFIGSRLCAFSSVVDRDLFLSAHVSRLVFLFSCPQNPSINHLNFYCIKQIDNIFLYVYCNRSQKTSQRVKNNSHATRLRLVSYVFVLYTL